MNLLCRIGLHKWFIVKWEVYRNSMTALLGVTESNRECKGCSSAKHVTEDEMNERCKHHVCDEDDDHDPECTDWQTRRNLDGDDAPYPGMATAFEAHYGQSWTDPDWRKEAAVWAAAWKHALRQQHFQKLGARLAELLDEDQCAECEALLLSAGVTPNAGGKADVR